jgi:hypothetical protein
LSNLLIMGFWLGGLSVLSGLCNKVVYNVMREWMHILWESWMFAHQPFYISFYGIELWIHYTCCNAIIKQILTITCLQLWIISLEITYSKGEVHDPRLKLVESFLIQKTTSPKAHFTLESRPMFNSNQAFLSW